MHEYFRIISQSKVLERWEDTIDKNPEEMGRQELLYAYELAEALFDPDIEFDYSSAIRYSRDLFVMMLCHRADTLEQALEWLNDLENEKFMESG